MPSDAFITLRSYVQWGVIYVGDPKIRHGRYCVSLETTQGRIKHRVREENSTSVKAVRGVFYRPARRSLLFSGGNPHGGCSAGTLSERPPDAPSQGPSSLPSRKPFPTQKHAMHFALRAAADCA